MLAEKTYSLLSECHFWTFRDEVRIKNCDFGAFRYQRQRELQQFTADVAAAAKRDYTEKRNSIAVLKNTKKGAQKRLKDNLKKLEELLKLYKIVYQQWRDATQLLLMFNNGIIVHICVDIYTGDILRMLYEKYFVAKLAAEITDAFFTRSHIVLAYNTNQLTVVHLQKPSQRPQRPEKISNMDPRIFHVIIPGAAERKLHRHLIVNSSFDLFVVWTTSSQNEVYPWRPTLREADRANIHIFKLKDAQLESIAYCWSEYDPLCVDFLRSSESQILTVEEKVSRKGEISAEICSYEITSGRMQRSVITSIPLGTQICCYSFSPDQEKLFLGAIDRKICLHDLVKQTTKFVTEVDIIPTHCTWHSDSSIVMVANDRSQFQCFDLALTPIANQLQSEDVTPSNLLDLSHYFAIQPTLLSIAFSRKPDLGNFNQSFAQTDCLLLLIFENGPIGVLRFFAGAGMRGDIHNSGLTADVIIDKYLALNQLEKAVNLLQALNWETYGAMCLISLHKIANYVFYRSDLRGGRIELLSKALKTFTDDLSEETKDEFSDQVFDLKRRFFFYLLRKNLFAEAFEIALDIDDYDLFMDLYNITKSNIDLIEFSAAAFSQAAAILHEEERANGTHVSLLCDFRSESALSQFSTSTETAPTNLQQSRISTTTQHFNKQALKNYVPPLPSFKSKIFNAEMIKINIPKPELCFPYNDNLQQEQNLQVPLNSSNLITSTSMTPPIMSSTIATTLAALTAYKAPESNLKNNSTNLNDVTTENLPNNAKLTTENQQQQQQKITVPDQTIGIPTTQQNSIGTSIYSSPTCATKPGSNTFAINSRTPAMKQNQRKEQVPSLMQYAKPANVIAADQLLLTATQRNFQQHHAPLQTPLSTYGCYQPKFYQHPLVSGTIPPTNSSSTKNTATTQSNKQQMHLGNFPMKKPTVSILTNTNQMNVNSNTVLTQNNGTSLTTNGMKETTTTTVSKSTTTGEKNKVKFSDTVQVAVVPDIQRKEKPMPPKRNGYSRPMQRNQFMNPRKELADSLPLCHPNDDYLKDFNPLSTDIPLRPAQAKSQNSRDERKSSSKAAPAPPPSIKVVHFGVV